ncbi:hypothetical protein [Clostridium sp. BJN0001]|uniref:anti-sigma-I factor RsgI family protein n=1 Tax=Clostridium sp. BJN0001 TaxID=2930219 RepID=UPI001FD4CFA7|nr:hypothetical protein [Clostridium sp. BJN0001]
MSENKFIKNKYSFSSLPSVILVGKKADDIRKKQVILYIKELYFFNIFVKDLVNEDINVYKRNLAINVAYFIISDEDLVKEIYKKKEIPIFKIARMTNLKPMVISECKDYITAYFILINNPLYKVIQDYVRVVVNENDTQSSNEVEIIKKEKNKNLKTRGLVLKRNYFSTFMITSYGEFIKIKNEKNSFKIGTQAEGRKKKSFKHYKIVISIFLCVILFAGAYKIADYKKVQSIIVIETTSSIKLHVNRYGKVIYLYSASQKGKELISKVKYQKKNTDTVLSEIFDIAYESDMIDLSKRTLITVSGTPLEYGQLEKTNKFVKENKISIIINNGGNRQRLPDIVSEDEEN